MTKIGCDYNIGCLGPLCPSTSCKSQKLFSYNKKIKGKLSILFSYLDFPPNKSVCFMCMFTIFLENANYIFRFGLFPIMLSLANYTLNTNKMIDTLVYLTGPPKKLLIEFHEILPSIRVCQIYNNDF